MSKEQKETLEMIAKEPIKPVEVKWIVAPERIVETPTYHIHMTWMVVCTVIAAFAYYLGHP
jgi:hypothetical protein